MVVERGEAEEERGVDVITFGDSGENHVRMIRSRDDSISLSSLLRIILISYNLLNYSTRSFRYEGIASIVTVLQSVFVALSECAHTTPLGFFHAMLAKYKQRSVRSIFSTRAKLMELRYKSEERFRTETRRTK